MWVGLFLNSTTPIQLAETTATVEVCLELESTPSTTPGAEHRPVTVVDH
jgi:hypothetical protein